MDTIPTDQGRRLTRRQLQRALDEARTIIAGLDRTVEQQASTIDLVTSERDDAYEAVGRADHLHDEVEALAAQLAQNSWDLQRAEQVRDAALAAAEQAQAVTLRLLEVHHEQAGDHAKVVQALAETVSDALSERRGPVLPARPEPPELLPGGTHAITSGEPGVLVPVDGPPRPATRKRTAR